MGNVDEDEPQMKMEERVRLRVLLGGGCLEPWRLVVEPMEPSCVSLLCWHRDGGENDDGG